MRLGKLAPRISLIAPSLARLVAAAPPPPAADWTGKLTGEPAFLNLELGCCTIAAQAHITRIWTSQVFGAEVDVPDDMVRAAYFALTGGQDSGLAETTALEWWAARGFSIPGRQFESILTGWATCRSMDDLRRSVAWLGAAYIGLDMPVSAKEQVGGLWDVAGSLTGDAEPGSWGGHAVPVVAYDADGVTVLTWGKKQRATWAFMNAYVDEAHAPLSRLWLDTMGVAPSGMDMRHLASCMASIGG